MCPTKCVSQNKKNEIHCRALIVWTYIKPCVLNSKCLVIKPPLLISFGQEDLLTPFPADSYPHHQYTILAVLLGGRSKSDRAAQIFLLLASLNKEENPWQERREISLPGYIEEACKRIPVIKLIICQIQHRMQHSSSFRFLYVVLIPGTVHEMVAQGIWCHGRETAVCFMPSSDTASQGLLCWQDIEIYVLGFRGK